jgi:hypothetical protein
MDDGGGDYFIDDFSLVPQGYPAIDFSNTDDDDVVDIGAYEYVNPSLGTSEIINNQFKTFNYPNPAKYYVSISNLTIDDRILISDLLGKNYQLSQTQNLEKNTIRLDVSTLSAGLYLITVANNKTNRTQTLRLIKQ